VCIAHLGSGKIGGLRAFDAATGEVKWCFNDDSPASSSPILVNLAGERHVVTFTRRELLGVSAATGKLLWRIRCYHDYFENCVTPVQSKDLLIAAGRNEPPRAFRLEKGGQRITAKEVWRAKGTPSYLSSPVLAGDWLFGFSDQKMGHLFCLDAKTGETLWQNDGRLGSYAAILNAGSVWLVLTNKGRLIVVKSSGTAYEPIAQYRVSNTDTYAHPVFLGDRILIKDASTLKSFRIEQAGALHQ
jgi:outer membrane protein assembly factor BamB